MLVLDREILFCNNGLQWPIKPEKMIYIEYYYNYTNGNRNEYIYILKVYVQRLLI